MKKNYKLIFFFVNIKKGFKNYCLILMGHQDTVFLKNEMNRVIWK